MDPIEPLQDCDDLTVLSGWNRFIGSPAVLNQRFPCHTRGFSWRESRERLVFTLESLEGYKTIRKRWFRCEIRRRGGENPGKFGGRRREVIEVYFRGGDYWGFD